MYVDVWVGVLVVCMGWCVCSMYVDIWVGVLVVYCMWMYGLVCLWYVCKDVWVGVFVVCMWMYGLVCLWYVHVCRCMGWCVCGMYVDVWVRVLVVCMDVCVGVFVVHVCM